MSIDAYHTFHYLLVGGGPRNLQIHSLHTFISVMLAMRADPIFIREELLARGYSVTSNMISECEHTKMPSDPAIYMKWISSISEGIVQSKYGYQKLAQCLGIPIPLANAEYDARHTSKHTPRPIHDITHTQHTSSSQSLPNVNVNILPRLRPEDG